MNNKTEQPKSIKISYKLYHYLRRNAIIKDETYTEIIERLIRKAKKNKPKQTATEKRIASKL